ncbi:MAG: hypothetical protein J6B71_11525 [Clostridia bacterium]|nr:hypothetical protein [Clostridia bacterium]
MNEQQNCGVKSMICAHKKMICITAGVVGGVALLGVAAAMVWNCKQLRTARMFKRTGKVLYAVGTAMRNVSCMDCD